MLPDGDKVTIRQHRRCVIPQAVNTVQCSWGWAKLSPETCWADCNYQLNLLLLRLVGCLYYFINDARSHKHQTSNKIFKSLFFVFSFFQDYSQPRRNIQSYKTFLRRVCPECRKCQVFCFVFTLIFYVTTLKLHLPCKVRRWKISNHILVLGRMLTEMVLTYLQSSALIP